MVNDPTARITVFESGKAHMINRVEPKVVALLKRAPGLEVISTPGRGQYLFLMHCDKPPFDNAELRLAMKYAIDREQILKLCLQGYGSIGNDQPINSPYPFFAADIPQYQFDLDKAKFHVKKSGFDGNILLHTSDVAFTGAVDAATLLQASAAQAGIKIDIKRDPGDGYWDNVWNKEPFCASFGAAARRRTRCFPSPISATPPGTTPNGSGPISTRSSPRRAPSSMTPSARCSIARRSS